jgi:hypothetical protein
MATLDGLTIIEADEVNSSIITFTNYLNGISHTTFNNISGTTSNIQLQLNNLALVILGIYTSSTGFTFIDTNSIGFVVSNSSYDYIDFEPAGNSNITTPQINFNTGQGGTKFYSYNFSNYPSITLNQLNFEIYTDGLTGITDYVRSYVKFMCDTYEGTDGFTFNDTNSIGFIAATPHYNYLDIEPAGESTITTPVIDFNTGAGGVNFYSYNFQSYPSITLNQLNFEIYTDGLTGVNDYVKSYIKFIAVDIENVNMKTSNIIECNIYDRNLNANAGGFLLLFCSAINTDIIQIGSNVSTTEMRGQAVSINSPFYCHLDATFSNPVYCNSSLTCASTTTFNSTAIFNNYATFNQDTAFNHTSYFNSPIIGNTAGFTSLSASVGLTIAGSYGVNTKMVYLNNTSPTSDCYSNISMSSSDLKFDAKNGLSGNATSIYFNTTDTSNMTSNTMLIQNTSISLNKPTSFTGLITSGNGLTFNGTAINNKITNLYQMTFDNNYGHQKIILYDNGNVYTNYSIGVLSNTLYYNTPMYHSFFVNGSNTQAVLSLTSTDAIFSGILNAPALQLKGVGSNVFQLGNLLTPSCLTIDYQGNLNTIGKITFGSGSMILNCNKTGVLQNLLCSSNGTLPTTGICNTQIGNNITGATTGSYNISMGYTAGTYITTGSDNVAIGHNAMYHSNLGGGVGANLTGCTCIGAGATITSGIANYSTSIGYNSNCGALNAMAIGYGAYSNFQNSTAIGQSSFTTATNQISLGDVTDKVICNGTSNGISLIVATGIKLSSSKTSWSFPSLLGSQVSVALTPNKPLTVNGTQYNIIQYTITQVGVYSCQAQVCCIFGTNANTSLLNCSLSTTSATIDPFCQISIALPTITGHQQFSQLNKTFQITNTTTIIYMVASSSNNTTIPYLNDNLTYMTFTRIA